MVKILINNWFKKIWIYPYTLKTKHTKKIREACLLKVEFIDGKVGHSDLHPWPEKGEVPLKNHLENLKNKQFTDLCYRSIFIAQEEAQAQGINLLSGLKIPLSHYLVLDITNFKNVDSLLNLGFKIFKVKLNNPLKYQTQKLLELMHSISYGVKWRLDFTSGFTIREWEQWTTEFLPQIPLEHLDFIEVPIEYKERLWQKHKKYCLALDCWSGKNTLAVHAVIWKSSRKSTKELLKLKSQELFKRVIFTHSLAHPLDQLASAYFAAQFYKVHPRHQETCALVQTDIYENHEFSLLNKGPVFPSLSEHGWGLNNNLLNRLSWKKWIF